MTRKFPTLTTRRLTLRAVKPGDADAFHALLTPEVTRYMNWPNTPTRARIARFMVWMTKLYASGKGCAWIIEETATGALLGGIRFNLIERKALCGEIGYELARPHWGKGLMSEAVRAVVAFGHDTLGLNRIEAWTLPGNPASDRVLLKAGFRLEGILAQKARFKGAYHDLRMFGRVTGEPIRARRGT